MRDISETASFSVLIIPIPSVIIPAAQQIKYPIRIRNDPERFAKERRCLYDMEKETGIQVKEAALQKLAELCTFCGLCPCPNIRSDVIQGKNERVRKEVGGSIAGRCPAYWTLGQSGTQGLQQRPVVFSHPSHGQETCRNPPPTLSA